MNEERWSVIAEAPEYEVSTTGRVRNIKRKNFITGSIDRDGYPRVMLCTKGPNGDYEKCKKIVRFRHRLVAIAFIPNPENYPVVNHIDEDKSNSNVENLEWCSVRYNVNYGEGAKSRAKKLKELQRDKLHRQPREVYVYDKDTHEFIGRYDSMTVAAKELDCDYRTIYKVAKGIVGKSHHGMIFSLEPLQFD